MQGIALFTVKVRNPMIYLGQVAISPRTFPAMTAQGPNLAQLFVVPPKDGEGPSSPIICLHRGLCDFTEKCCVIVYCGVLGHATSRNGIGSVFVNWA